MPYQYNVPGVERFAHFQRCSQIFVGISMLFARQTKQKLRAMRIVTPTPPSTTIARTMHPFPGMINIEFSVLHVALPNTSTAQRQECKIACHGYANSVRTWSSCECTISLCAACFTQTSPPGYSNTNKPCCIDIRIMSGMACHYINAHIKCITHMKFVMCIVLFWDTTVLLLKIQPF